MNVNPNPVIEKTSVGILSGVYRYTYVWNNPLKYIDPSGYWSTWSEIYRVIEMLSLGKYGGMATADGGFRYWTREEADIIASSGGYWQTRRTLRWNPTGSLFSTLPGGVSDGKLFNDKLVLGDFRLNLSFDEDIVWVPGYQINNNSTDWLYQPVDEIYNSITEDDEPIINLEPVYPDVEAPSSRISGGTATKIQNAANIVSSAASGAAVTLQSTKVGSDIAYNLSNNRIFLQSVKYLRPIATSAAGLNIISDSYLTIIGEQSIAETGINTAVTLAAAIISGPYGFALVVGYNFGKGGMEMIHDGLNEGILKPNPSPTSNYVPGLAPAFVIPNW